MLEKPAMSYFGDLFQQVHINKEEVLKLTVSLYQQGLALVLGFGSKGPGFLFYY